MDGAVERRLTGSEGRCVVVVCAGTAQYRRLARAMRGEKIIEIGTSCGECTVVLAQNNAVIGLDVSKEMIEKAKKANPLLEFHVMDVLMDTPGVVRLSQRQGTTAVFIDIGGNRMMETVIALVRCVLRNVRPKTIVVKCKSLAAALLTHLTTLEGESKTVKTNDGNGEVETERSGHAPADGDECCDLYAHFEAIELETTAHPQTTKGNKRFLHPLKYPLRLSPACVPICRYYNYSECKRRKTDRPSPSDDSASKDCEFDHSHCHNCGEKGHRAVHCEAFL